MAISMRAMRTMAILLVSMTMLCVAFDVDAQEPSDAEYRIKAAFLFHFFNYIDWPAEAFEDADSPLVLGVAAPETIVGQIRRTIGNRLARNRPLEIRKIEPGDPLESLHAVYITRSVEATEFNVDALMQPSLLIVTEEDEVLVPGSVINFVIEEDRVRFDIDPAAAKARELNVGAQLLTVARRIQRNRT